MECNHESGMLRKRKIRNVSLEQRDFNTQPCFLCTVVYPFWKQHTDMSLVSSNLASFGGSLIYDQNSVPIEIEYEDIKPIQRPDGRLDFSELLSNPPALNYEIKKHRRRFFRVELEIKQLGEAYHVLMCGLILRFSSDVKMGVEFKEPDMTKIENVQALKDIMDLFDWYGIDMKPIETNGLNNTSKEEATEVIAAAFRLPDGIPSAPYGQVKYNQPALFRHLRSELMTPGADLVKCGDLNRDYLHPTYAAKYWLNRYLSVTGQGKLPKEVDVSRLAVIHIRLSALSPVGRMMDAKNLEDVVRSIAEANHLANQTDGFSFSHIMVYGDFDYSEIDTYRRIIETALRPEKPTNRTAKRAAKKVAKKDAKKAVKNASNKASNQSTETTTDNRIKLLFISSAWNAPSTPLHGKAKDVASLWQKYRSTSSDHLPIQVKNLAIWTTLCQRYHPKICVIGHRSGFIEGAAFIGIPVFYLMNERNHLYFADAKGGNVAVTPGDLLWRTPANSGQNRLRDLSKVMDTFIPVFALGERESDKDVYRIEDAYEKELTAALFMYMCCDVVYGLKISPLEAMLHMKNPCNPAWTARVDLMGDTCQGQGHEPGKLGCEDAKYLASSENLPETGQEWLRRRYLFATGRAAEVRLVPWSGVLDGKWRGMWGLGARALSGRDFADLLAGARGVKEG
ncbi:hypothetical protein B0J11DRAFT_510532 [Dendryphion nanum]|uniref:Uncharacterized protein n=1 Tax=Dendryphion nanum TaxID=256645 RepID=A0A9P9IDS7_9PLEO|nr:hypothetical protein B0J11DRAFT_510532 [Dendryphion nanum]